MKTSRAICDRCGAGVPRPNYSGDLWADHWFDLCDPCKAAFREWMGNAADRGPLGPADATPPLPDSLVPHILRKVGL